MAGLRLQRFVIADKGARLGLGSVLGYLIAGCIIGPWGLRLVTDAEAILHLSIVCSLRRLDKALTIMPGLRLQRFVIADKGADRRASGAGVGTGVFDRRLRYRPVGAALGH
jgi:hypothetical protein